MIMLLPNLVDTKRATTTVDSGGSPIETFATNLTSVKCNVQAITGDEFIQGGRKLSRPAYKIYFEAGTDVILKDRIVFGGDTFEIVEPGSYPDAYAKFFMEKAN